MINTTGHGGVHHLGVSASFIYFTFADNNLYASQDKNYSKSPYFYWSAQYVYADKQKSTKNSTYWQCRTGPVFKAREGEKLTTKMWYDPVHDSWNSLMVSDTGRRSYLNVTNPYMNT